MYGMRSASMNLEALSSEPRTSKLTTPPKPLICRTAIACSLWLSRPG